MSLNSDLIIDDLVSGNKRFMEGKSIKSSALSIQKLKDFSEKEQLPKAIVLCCSDSRAPVEMIFDQDIGDLFVIRVAGNIVAPSLVGSVEFAANTFGTPLVLVMGHSKCGAVLAALQHIENCPIIPSENIHDIVSRIRPHVFSVATEPSVPHEYRLARAIEANVRASVNQLSHSSRLIEGLIQQGEIKVIGAILELSSGKVSFLDA